MYTNRKKNTAMVALAGGIATIVILLLCTLWSGGEASRDTAQAVHSVSLLYMDELADRREEVIASNLKDSISKIRIVVWLMKQEDLSDLSHMQAFLARIKTLYKLDMFGFMDTNGLIYTSRGLMVNSDEYEIDFKNFKEDQISIHTREGEDKKVVIAIPVSISFLGNRLSACFMETSLESVLYGVSMKGSSEETTFSNLYTSEGLSLSDVILGGMTQEKNLFDVLQKASFQEGYSLEQLQRDFQEGNSGVCCFSYQGRLATLSYVPVEGTNWLLTYLIRESIISAKIEPVSRGIIVRSLLQTLLTALILTGIFVIAIRQSWRNQRLLLERETMEAENRVKQEAMEQKLALQTQLLEREKQRTQQENLIKALAADYKGVYYVDLDTGVGQCYEADQDLHVVLGVEEKLDYREAITFYANTFVTEEDREEFLHFITTENIRESLKKERVISFRYLVRRGGSESYEMLRFASVHQPGETKDGEVHAVGACITDVDAQTRKAMAQSRALSEALEVANNANRAKTVFLSNMSHEIRTPMNAIIGLDNIALNEPDLPPKTREYLEKIGTSANHLLSLINDILDMSRIEAGRIVLKNEEFSFSKLLEHLSTLFSNQCSEKKLTYECRVNGYLDDYYIGDSTKLRQVLINLLGNAVKFTPEGGRVLLSVEKVAQYEGRSTLRFVVEDTGIGMSPEFLPHIFETFSQEDSFAPNKYGSSGLGLAITKSIVEIMNGEIQVESQKGEGTRFTVTLTLEDCEPKGEERDWRIRPGEISVLVVDDDPVAREHAQLVLGKVGVSCETASSGAEALEKVRLGHARSTPYQIILVDWQMEGMDGVETTRQIRKLVGNDSAILFLTGYHWDDVYEQALDAGVDAFLSKPLFGSSVLEEFSQALKKKSLRSQKEGRKADLRGRHILLAEDIQVNAEIMTLVLEMREMVTDWAQNGREALEKFAASPEGTYAAILMDLRMPLMGGLEAAAAIRALDREDAKSIPIIALTANAFDEDVQKSLQAGMNAHLSKPVEPESLYAALESFIKD